MLRFIINYITGAAVDALEAADRIWEEEGPDPSYPIEIYIRD